LRAQRGDLRRLSGRQRDVLERRNRGDTLKTIAIDLGIAPQTVAIYEKRGREVSDEVSEKSDSSSDTTSGAGPATMQPLVGETRGSCGPPLRELRATLRNAMHELAKVIEILDRLEEGEPT